MMISKDRLQIKTKADLSFWEHLEDFRKKLLWALLFFLILLSIALWKADLIIQLLLKPLRDISDINIVYIKPHEKLLSYIKVAFFASLSGALPFLLIQLSRFVYPALKPKEKRYFSFTFIGVFVLFLCGIIFSYIYFTPFVIEFLLNFSLQDGIMPLWSIGEYIHLILLLIFGVAFIFWLPLILLAFIRFHIIPLSWFKKSRKFVLLAVLFIAAVLTPPDIYSQVIVGGILYLLFEATLIIARYWDKK